jgi:NADH-quinone oxidoreductase E subunit
MLISPSEKLKEELQSLVQTYGPKRSALLPILQEIQRRYGHVSNWAMQLIADRLDIHPVEVYSVVSFYHFLSEKPQGKFVVRLCRTISCDLAGKERVARQLENELGIEFGQTTEDGRFTLLWANCIGLCDQGPALMVNDQVYSAVTPEKIHDIVEECRKTFSLFATEAVEKENIL